MMYKFFLLIPTFFLLLSCNNTKNEPKPEEMAKDSNFPVEIGDTSLIAMGEAHLAALTAGDMDAFVANFADDAVYSWNNGDTLVGIPAIKEYWTKRRKEMITSITFNNTIFLPLKVDPSTFLAGKWLLGWYDVEATYVTGKSMTQMIHTVWRFNESGKVDMIMQYLDRVPINAAMTK